MGNIRQAVFAGTWYPGSASGCQNEIEKMTVSSSMIPDTSGAHTGGIVPHAGWYFSGSIACDVMRQLKSTASDPDVVVIFGTHMHATMPISVMRTGAWETPLGNLSIHEPLAEELMRRVPGIRDASHATDADNTIEIQLPFIRYFWKRVKILPVSAPPASISIEAGKSVAAAATALGLKIIVLGSTDLTHYGPNYGLVLKRKTEDALEWVRHDNDKGMIDAMLSMSPEAVIAQAQEKLNGCCAGAAAAALSAGRTLGAVRGKLMAYATSFDKSPGESFVGYAGIVF